MNKWLLIGLNICIMCLGIFLAFRYSTSLQEERTDMTRDSFAFTIDSMEQVSMSYLRSQQEYENNWAEYINANYFTKEEAFEYLSNANSSSEITSQIIDISSWQGLSTKESALRAGDYEVSYEQSGEELQEKLTAIANGTDQSQYLHITDTFANPIDGIQVIGFGAKITLKEQHQSKDYLLLRLVPLTLLREQWVFPTGYEEAEIGLINSNGDYIIRSNVMKSENFFEFIRAYNDLTYPEKDQLQAKMNKKENGILEYKDARGQEAYWVYSTLTEETDNWILVGYVPISTLESYGMDWPVILIVCGVMLLLMLVDGFYFIKINNKLRESMEEANKANEAKTRFLSSMSHDIRTPMNAIIGMTSIATCHIDDTERIKDCLKKIAMASSHLLTLINDILDISKVESGQLVLNPLVFSLPDIISNLTNIVRTQITSKSQDFRVHTVNIKHEYLYADELRLNQIFINILSNAVKYTPVGGRITMSLREEEPDETGKTVRLIYEVSDTGIGMSPEFAQTIFRPFTRAKDSRIDTIEGSGLGLAITKQMVDAMGGSIRVESEEGKGSVFTVILDLPVAEKMAADLMLPPVRMLVADDDEICLETTAEMLQSLGVSADLADSGEKAVSMAAEEHSKGTDYPIILLDWKMPGMDGIAAARAIRQEVGDEVSIIILSAFDWSQIEEEAKEAGISAFINKPTFRSSMYETLLALLRPEEKTEDFESDLKTEEFSGTHLLVAEDNEMNWEIIKELLSLYGISADRAENGAVCVQMLTDCPEDTYRAVLMDIQMPVMNGREAAYKIRHAERDYVRKIPIIAMTADAFAEDVRACLDVGMNGHVAKPVDMDLLIAELRKI